MVSVFVSVLQNQLIEKQSLFIDEQKSSYEKMLSNKDKELKGMKCPCECARHAGKHIG